MATVARPWIGRQIIVEVGVARAGDVPALVGRVPGVGLREPEAAVDDDPIRFRKALRQRVAVY